MDGILRLRCSCPEMNLKRAVKRRISFETIELRLDEWESASTRKVTRRCGQNHPQFNGFGEICPLNCSFWVYEEFAPPHWMGRNKAGTEGAPHVPPVLSSERWERPRSEGLSGLCGDDAIGWLTSTAETRRRRGMNVNESTEALLAPLSKCIGRSGLGC